MAVLEVEVVRSGWILAVNKGKPTGFSGIMDMRSKKKNRVQDVSKMFSLHVRKNGVANFKIRGDRFTLRSSLGMPRSSWIHSS